MGDWTYGAIILFCAVAWVHIFVDYRKRLIRMMPGVEEVSTRKESFSHQISAAENSSQEFVHSIGDLHQELKTLDEKRKELQQQLNEKEMVLIPPGKFEMGSDLSGHDQEQPLHTVRLKGYYIDKYEVTNIEYRDFVHVTGRRAPIHWINQSFPARVGNHPVVNVSWEDAQAYAEWVGKRLPTEAEWERAARGDRGKEYPWGNTSSTEYANFGEAQNKTTPVDQYSGGKSEYQVFDMCGNVGEWVHDWYDARYYSRSPEADPTGSEGGQQKVYRGGGYHCNKMDIRAAARHFSTPKASLEYIGFRCAMDAD